MLDWILAIAFIYACGGAVGLAFAMTLLKEHVENLVREADATTGMVDGKRVTLSKAQKFALAKRARKVNRMRWATVYAWPLMLPVATVWAINTSLRKDGAGIAKIMAENSSPDLTKLARAAEKAQKTVEAAHASDLQVLAETRAELVKARRAMEEISSDFAKHRASSKKITPVAEWTGDNTYLLTETDSNGKTRTRYYSTANNNATVRPQPWKNSMESGDSVTRDAMGKEVRRTVKRNGRYITVYPVGISDTGFVKYANGGIVPLSTAEVSSEPDPYVLHVDDCPVATWKEAVEAPREALGSLRMPDWGNYLPTATSLAQAKGPDDACKAVGIDKAERYEGMDPAPTRVREDPFIGDNRS